MVSFSAVFPPPRIGLGAMGCVLIGLLLSGTVRSAQAQHTPFQQHTPFHTPLMDSIIAAEDSMAAAQAARADTSGRDRHAVLRGLNALDGALPSRLVNALIVLGFMIVPTASAVGFAAVALFLEAGCLRMLLAIMGWLAALLGGLTGGGLLGAMLGGGLPFVIGMGIIACGVGYLAAYVHARNRIEQLPREAYLTWKHTITSGALLGTGASSAARLMRSAGTLFTGGGGSFGGGGASGPFGGGATLAPGAGASGVVASGAAPMAGGTVSVGAESARGATAHPDCNASSVGNRIRRLGHALGRSLRRLRWYHGVGFVLVGIGFLPVGMGITAIVQRPHLLLWVAGMYTLVRAYWLVVQLSPGGAPSDVASGLFTVLLFMGPFIGGALAAASRAPQWHLSITLIMAAVIEVGSYVLPDRRATATPWSGQAPPFRGGGTSQRW